jgi:hypothetical protein
MIDGLRGKATPGLRAQQYILQETIYRTTVQVANKSSIGVPPSDHSLNTRQSDAMHERTPVVSHDSHRIISNCIVRCQAQAQTQSQEPPAQLSLCRTSITRAPPRCWAPFLGCSASATRICMLACLYSITFVEANVRSGTTPSRDVHKVF